VGNQKKRDKWEQLDLDGKIFKWILGNGSDMDWIHLARDSD
jgi:hypothetical protein